jgi:hypothetical protein
MLTYTTLDGRVLDLSGLNEREQAFLRRSYAAYCDDMNWADFANLVEQSENPLIAATGGLITRQVIGHHLHQAVTDLMYRLWFRQGKLQLTPGQDPSTPPLADELLPATGVRLT